MSKPIVLIHGYSAESAKDDLESMREMYGDLPEFLRGDTDAGHGTVEINLSRYLSLRDSISIYDVARALNRALVQEYPHLLEKGFHVVIHSTGALVIRNWIKMYSPKPSPVRSIIYLAGANFGSGWAGVGQGQLARYGRFVFQNAAQRGVKILQALELGSSQTLDLHNYFISPASESSTTSTAATATTTTTSLTPSTKMLDEYKVLEYILNGTQAVKEWFTYPVRYGRECGSDGTVRVSGANLNYNYLQISPLSKVKYIHPETKKEVEEDPELVNWEFILNAMKKEDLADDFPSVYHISHQSLPIVDRKFIPIAIIAHCAHTGDEFGIVKATNPIPREQTRGLIRRALNVPDRNDDASNWEQVKAAWENEVAEFSKITDETYKMVFDKPKDSGFLNLEDYREQYNAYAQVIIRLQDQNGNPVNISDASIAFDSDQEKGGAATTTIDKLIDDKVVNGLTPNVVTYYVKVTSFNPDVISDNWRDHYENQLDRIANFALEITAVEPLTPIAEPNITYLPLRIPLKPVLLQQFIHAHRTTVIDVTLVRIPFPDNVVVRRFIDEKQKKK